MADLAVDHVVTLPVLAGLLALPGPAELHHVLHNIFTRGQDT